MLRRSFVLRLFPYFCALLTVLLLPRISAQKSAGPRWLIGDQEDGCGTCSRTQGKPVCGSDGRSYETNCDLQRAKCKDRSLTVAHRGRCRGKGWPRIDQSPSGPGPTSSSEGRHIEMRDAGQSKCRTDRSQAMDQVKRTQESVFIPECTEDGSYAQVQCHTLTGYCWCVTQDGKPVSGSSVHNKTPVCSGLATDKPPGPPNSGRKDDGSKPTPTVETQAVPDGDEITAPTLWIKQLVKDSRQNISINRRPEKVHSCDQERQNAMEEAKLNHPSSTYIPECGPGILYKPVQCHQSTGYCWCVLVDTGRPIPGSSTRYNTPVCDSEARSKVLGMDDVFRDRELQGCPEGKKTEFITSLVDALTTDMVQAINTKTPSGGGRFVEPDPTHTLEERVVHWYFAQLDNNGSHDINKKELKPFKRYVKKKAKPRKCARKFTDYCDVNMNKAISLDELKGCLGVNKDGGASVTSSGQGSSQGSRSSSMKRGGLKT